MSFKTAILGAVLTLGLSTGAFSVAAQAQNAQSMTIYKSPYCGCCTAWADAMEEAGFSVTIKEADDLTPVKQMAGVPETMQSCHTAVVHGYVLEGHVPLNAVQRLLTERPAIKGLAVPGMPIGSLGMGEPDADTNYTVYALLLANTARPEAYMDVREGRVK